MKRCLNFYNSKKHIVEGLQQFTPEGLKSCIDELLKSKKLDRMLFCLAFQIIHYNLTLHPNLLTQLQDGLTPWKSNLYSNSIASEIVGDWFYPNDGQLKLEMRSHYDYWGKALFESEDLKLKQNNDTGLSTFLVDSYMPNYKLVTSCMSYVEVLTDAQFKKMQQYGHPSLWQDTKGVKGILFGWLALFNHKPGKYSMTSVNGLNQGFNYAVI